MNDPISVAGSDSAPLVSEAATLLANSAILALYFRGGFRMLDLPADATVREVGQSKFKTSSKGAASSEIHKGDLGFLTAPDSQEAPKVIEQAKRPDNLREAADFLKQALNKILDLRGQYEYLLQFWRKRMIT